MSQGRTRECEVPVIGLLPRLLKKVDCCGSVDFRETLRAWVWEAEDLGQLPGNIPALHSVFRVITYTSLRFPDPGSGKGGSLTLGTLGPVVLGGKAPA